MKYSEELQVRLETLKADDKALCKEMVHDKVTPANSELYEKLWCEYWQQFGRDNRRAVEQLERDIIKEKNREVEVGDGVTVCLYTDRHAATVIARTKCTLTIQHDKATLKESFKPEFIPGGFGAHCANNDEQEYDYERDENGQVEVFRWSEKYGRWCKGEDQSIKLTLGRHEFYDYNF